MPSYILRNIDDKLWVRVKARAEKQCMPLRQLLLTLLDGYASGSITVNNPKPSIGKQE